MPPRGDEQPALRADPVSWPFFSTPLRYFAAVFGPIALLMAPATALAPRGWMQASAALVLAISLYALMRGYFCRVRADALGVHYRSITRRYSLAWPQVRRVGRYDSGPGGAAYVFVTRHDTPPQGRWDIDGDTIQLQDRAGLLDALDKRWNAAKNDGETP